MGGKHTCVWVWQTWSVREGRGCHCGERLGVELCAGRDELPCVREVLLWGVMWHVQEQRAGRV